MVVATFCFTSLDAILKMLAAEHSLGMLVLVRNLVQVLLLAALAPALGRGLLRTRRLPLHLARGACLVATTVLVVLALTHLPMAQTYAITFSAPLMASLLAVAALKERPYPMQWVLIGVGFLGVLVAIGPGTPEFGWPLLLPLAMAAANAVFYVLTRYGGLEEEALTLAFWAAATALLWCLLALPLIYAPLPPRALAWLVLGGTFGTLAHLAAAAAFRHAPTATVSPLLYSQIVWAALIGFLVFGEVPRPMVLIGGAIVAASGIGIVRLSARRGTRG
jgi:drug/metabolite transporter (DMT)-like permease